MKHICHLTSVHKWNDVRIFEKECVSLAKAGFKVSLIAVNGKTGKQEGVDVISVDVPNAGRLKRMTKVVNEVYRAALNTGADIYHLHDPELLRIAGKLKKLGKKVVYDSHEDLPRQILDKTWINRLIRSSVSGITERYENSVASKADGIVTATPYIRDRFLKVNKNTVDINNFPIAAKFSVNTSWKDKKNEICYVGGIFASRGIVELVDALGSLEVRLNLAGNFSPATLRNKLTGKSGWKKVIEHGFANRQKIQEILAASKIGIVTLHPTRAYTHALPVKMFEYMAAGIPVIASDFPLWKSIIEKHRCGICVNPKDPAAIAEAVRHLMKNEQEAERMGANGRKAVEDQFSWENEEKKLISFYLNLAGK